MGGEIDELHTECRRLAGLIVDLAHDTPCSDCQAGDKLRRLVGSLVK
jgi:hypothetical protein